MVRVEDCSIRTFHLQMPEVFALGCCSPLAPQNFEINYLTPRVHPVTKSGATFEQVDRTRFRDWKLP